MVQEDMAFKRFLIWSSDGPPVQKSRTIYAILKEGIMGNTHVFKPTPLHAPVSIPFYTPYSIQPHTLYILPCTHPYSLPYLPYPIPLPYPQSQTLTYPYVHYITLPYPILFLKGYPLEAKTAPKN